MPSVQHGDFQINYGTYGTGEAIVLLHGIFGNGNDWLRNNYDKELPDYQLILIDLRGHGKSTKSYNAIDYDPYVQAGDIDAVLQKLGITTTTIWGYSFGARIAFAFAIKYPNKVNRLIIGGMHPYLVDEVFHQIRKRMSIIRKGMDAWINYLDQSNIELEHEDRRTLLDNDHNALVAIDVSILKWSGFREDLTILEKEQIPIFVYLGERDRSYRAKAVKFVNSNPSAKIVFIKNKNHFSAFSDSKQVISALQHEWGILL